MPDPVKGDEPIQEANKPEPEIENPSPESTQAEEINNEIKEKDADPAVEKVWGRPPPELSEDDPGTFKVEPEAEPEVKPEPEIEPPPELPPEPEPTSENLEELIAQDSQAAADAEAKGEKVFVLKDGDTETKLTERGMVNVAQQARAILKNHSEGHKFLQEIKKHSVSFDQAQELVGYGSIFTGEVVRAIQQGRPPDLASLTAAVAQRMGVPIPPQAAQQQAPPPQKAEPKPELPDIGPEARETIETIAPGLMDRIDAIAAQNQRFDTFAQQTEEQGRRAAHAYAQKQTEAFFWKVDEAVNRAAETNPVIKNAGDKFKRWIAQQGAQGGNTERLLDAENLHALSAQYNRPAYDQWVAKLQVKKLEAQKQAAAQAAGPPPAAPAAPSPPPQEMVWSGDDLYSRQIKEEIAAGKMT